MKKPWNLPDLPVYSLATYAEGGFNMNICTYVSAVSMKPKRFMVAVYEGTKSLENMLVSEYAVLQLLHASQGPLVRPLGKKSALHYDKQSYLHKKNALAEWENYTVLKDASAWMLLRKLDSMPAGDHRMFLCDVVKHRVNIPEPLLTLDALREQKIISI